MERPGNESDSGSGFALSRRANILTCVVIVSLACLGAGFVALISTGAIGGSAMGVAPQVTFYLVAPVLCQPGETLEFTSTRRSYHQPGESEPHLACINAAGVRRDVLGRGILSVLGLVFLATWSIVFVLAAIPLGIAALFVLRWLRRQPSNPAPR